MKDAIRNDNGNIIVNPETKQSVKKDLIQTMTLPINLEKPIEIKKQSRIKKVPEDAPLKGYNTRLSDEDTKRAESFKENCDHMTNIAVKSVVMEREFMTDLLNLNLQKTVGVNKLEEEIRTLEDKKNEKSSIVMHSEKYLKVRKNAIKKLEKKNIKLKKKMFKKFKKRFGKKVAKILMYNSYSSICEIAQSWRTEYPISKKLDNKLKEKYEERKQMENNIDNNKQFILDKCPKISSRDAMMIDDSNISKEKSTICDDSSYLNILKI